MFSKLFKIKPYIQILIFVSMLSPAYSVIVVGEENQEEAKLHTHAFALKGCTSLGAVSASGGFINITTSQNTAVIIGLTAKHCLQGIEDAIVEAVDNQGIKNTYVVTHTQGFDPINVNVPVANLPKDIATHHLIKSFTNQLNSTVDLAILFFSHSDQEIIRKKHNILILPNEVQHGEVINAEFVGYGMSGLYKDGIMTTIPQSVGTARYMTATVQSEQSRSYSMWVGSTSAPLSALFTKWQSYLKGGIDILTKFNALTLVNVADQENTVRKEYIEYLKSLPSPGVIPCQNERERELVGRLLIAYPSLPQVIEYFDNDMQKAEKLFDWSSLKLIINLKNSQKTDGVLTPGDSGGILFDSKTKSALGLARNIGLRSDITCGEVSFCYDANLIQYFTSLQDSKVVDWIKNQVTLHST